MRTASKVLLSGAMEDGVGAVIVEGLEGLGDRGGVCGFAADGEVVEVA